MEIIDDQGNTELHLAAQNNNLQKVWSIMKKHISNQDLNLKNKSGNTALHIACKYHNMDIVEYITRFGGKMNIKNDEGMTPLDYLNETEKLRFSEFQDCLYGLGKYKFVEKEGSSHVFMGQAKRITLN
jgi:ankyrin repeat protein